MFYRKNEENFSLTDIGSASVMVAQSSSTLFLLGYSFSWLFNIENGSNSLGQVNTKNKKKI